MKRKIYIARRILPDPTGEMTLNVTNSMEVEEITSLYVGKEIQKEKFVHNGHWILRPVVGEGNLASNNLPVSLTPSDILHMVRTKIDSSDVLVAILGEKSFGAIVELGYAVGRLNIAVYVLPEQHLDHTTIKDLWLSFYFALQTQHLWSQDDIEAVAEFKIHGITTVDEYRDFILSIIPNFLEKA